jgi:L-lactate utilization protein LutC
MADDLLSQLEESAAQIGWTVTRSGSLEDAARRVGELARDLQVRSIVRSAHPVLERMSLEGTLADSGVELWVMAAEAGAEASAEEQRRAMRRRVVETDMGLTGVDYAIAETGSCVLMARRGVSRLAPLLPPVHVVIVEKGQVLPSMDELFTLQRWDFLDGVRQGYMNIISGPSRSADIEQTLVKGVHGPGDVYMILLG